MTFVIVFFPCLLVIAFRAATRYARVQRVVLRMLKHGRCCVATEKFRKAKLRRIRTRVLLYASGAAVASWLPSPWDFYWMIGRLPSSIAALTYLVLALAAVVVLACVVVLVTEGAVRVGDWAARLME